MWIHHQLLAIRGQQVHDATAQILCRAVRPQCASERTYEGVSVSIVYIQQPVGAPLDRAISSEWKRWRYTRCAGNFLLIYIFNFYVLNHFLLIYICKLHWNRYRLLHPLKEREHLFYRDSFTRYTSCRLCVHDVHMLWTKSSTCVQRTAVSLTHSTACPLKKWMRSVLPLSVTRRSISQIFYCLYCHVEASCHCRQNRS